MTVDRGKSSAQKAKQTVGKRPLTAETAGDNGTAAVGERQITTDQVEAVVAAAAIGGALTSNSNHVINR
jgi:hypothetical protein